MTGPHIAVNREEERAICVLVVSSATQDHEAMGALLASWNFEALEASDPAEALEIAKREPVYIAVVFDPEPGARSLELVRALRRERPGLESIVLADEPSETFATEAFRAGAYDFLTRPVDFEQLSRNLHSLRETVRSCSETTPWDIGSAAGGMEGLVGISAPMQAVFAAIRRLATDDSPVLITGLTGTGKERAAQALHALSGRTREPLVVYRCFGVSEAVATMDLFGEPAGHGGEAVPGDLQAGRVLHLAAGGTLLLDEIGDLPLAVQARLANLLSEGRLSGKHSHLHQEKSVRLLAATRLNPADYAAHGEFSPELYRLLSSNLIHLPSLGERLEDIPLLCGHFLQKFNHEFGKSARGFSPAARKALLSHAWPGNVRELENVIGGACLVAEPDCIERSDLSIVSPGVATAEEGWRSPMNDRTGLMFARRKTDRRLRSPERLRGGAAPRD